ncbi:MAG: hypothetical protein AAFO94_10885 [Bacteroidota bacterium]
MLQVPDNPPIPLEAFAAGKFKSANAGLIIEFQPERQELHVRQAGRHSILKRE